MVISVIYENDSSGDVKCYRNVGILLKSFRGSREHEKNFWEQGNSAKVDLGEHVKLLFENKGETLNYFREQGNMTSLCEALRLSLA